MNPGSERRMITEVTRRNIIDALRAKNVVWHGRLEEAEFLGRTFALSSLPSNDPRFQSFRDDIWQHRVNNNDWPDDWVYEDGRVGLLSCSDSEFLRFLCEMLHPIVRTDAHEVDDLVRLFNENLASDGWELAAGSQISGRPVFEPRQRGTEPPPRRSLRTYEYDLPNNFERLAATLSVYYERTGRLDLRRLLANAVYDIDEEVGYDNWDGGQHYHAVHFRIPSAVFRDVAQKSDEVSKTLLEDLNRFSSYADEHISKVYLELDDSSLTGWRENTGALVEQQPSGILLTDDELKRIWTPGYLRVFLSHRAEHRAKAAELKDALVMYGLSGFVAHADIEPTREWQNEIERALWSMHVMVLMLSDGFRDSIWANQEIGVAMGRRIPIVPIRLDEDPPGFVGKIQALQGRGKNPTALALDLIASLGRVSIVGKQLVETLVSRLEQSRSYSESIAIVKQLCLIGEAPGLLITRMEGALKTNDQVNGSIVARRDLRELIRKLRGRRDAE